MGLSARAHYCRSTAHSWEEIWEAGPYYERLSELFEDAKQYVMISGWQIDSRLPLSRPFRPNALTPLNPRETLRNKILRLCESKPDLHVYLLIWDHSYLYVPERELWQGRIWDELHPHVHLVFDNRHPLGGAHHEKLCIFDGRIALCGGIDLCGERWDSPAHRYLDPRRSLDWRAEKHGPYHDVAVQVSGPVCAEIQRHLAGRWKSLCSIPFPEPRSFSNSGSTAALSSGSNPSAGHAVYLSRTEADLARPKPRIIRENEFLFRDLIQSAEKSLLLEGQYFWSRILVDCLTAKMHARRGTDFEITLILADLTRVRSFTRKMANYEMSLLYRLQEAAQATATRLTLGAPYAQPPVGDSSRQARPIYIHSKLILVDDRYLCVGSANLASRALRIDTEFNLTFEARTEAERLHLRRLKKDIYRHWSIKSAPHGGSEPSAIQIHPFRPGRNARRGTIPYAKFFDPETPFGYFVKRRLRTQLAQRPLSWVALIGAWLASSAAIARLTDAQVPFERAYAVLMGGAWFLPLPPFVIALLTSADIGPERAGQLLAATLWVSSFVGYLGGRILPSQVRRLLSRTLVASRANDRDQELRMRLGGRTFGSLLAVLMDPRIEFRLKTAYPGITFTPLPWIALANGLIWPAAATTALHVICVTVPAPWIPTVAGALALIPWIRSCFRSHPEEAARASQN